MNITALDTNSASALQKEMAEALQAIAAKHGLKITAAGGSIKATDHANLTFAVRLTGEEAQRAAFAADCRLFFCKESDYGRVAMIQGKEYKLVGFAAGRSKYTVRVQETATGKIVLFQDSVLNRYFHTGTPAALPFANTEIKRDAAGTEISRNQIPV